MKNTGKIFEERIRASVPNYCLYHRLPDSPSSFGQDSSKVRFTLHNPFDAMMFDTKNRILYALELKSTKAKSMSFEDINIKGKQPNKMIHKHQILGLLDFAKYDYVEAGFLFNFRDEDNGTERTYYQAIDDFIVMCKEKGEKSFNEKDLMSHDAIEVQGVKKRVNYSWNLPLLLEKTKLKHVE